MSRQQCTSRQESINATEQEDHRATVWICFRSVQALTIRERWNFDEADVVELLCRALALTTARTALTTSWRQSPDPGSAPLYLNCGVPPWPVRPACDSSLSVLCRFVSRPLALALHRLSPLASRSPSAHLLQHPRTTVLRPSPRPTPPMPADPVGPGDPSPRGPELSRKSA